MSPLLLATAHSCIIGYVGASGIQVKKRRIVDSEDEEDVPVAAPGKHVSSCKDVAHVLSLPVSKAPERRNNKTAIPSLLDKKRPTKSQEERELDTTEPEESEGASSAVEYEGEEEIDEEEEEAEDEEVASKM